MILKHKVALKVFVLTGFCMLSIFSFSQIPTRYIVNSGFEFPVTGCSPPSYSFILQANVPGWRTLDSVPAPQINCGSTGSNAPYLIELWNNGFNSRASHTGSQFAEINANQATFLYQEICLLANEVVPFTVWHLRRAGSGVGEQMVAELKTTSNTNISTASIDTATSSWMKYTGSLTNNGSSGIRRYGFRAISGGSLGNLIDDVKISLKPLVDIKDFKVSTVYERDTNYLRIYINGTLKDTATVTIAKNGTATYNSDYSVGSPTRGSVQIDNSGNITLKLPAGDYNPNQSTGAEAGYIAIPFFITDESITESDETVAYSITGSANGGGGDTALNLSTGINGQSASCAATIGTGQFTIVDIISLPVKLLSFTAEREVGFNTIKWEVAEESHILKYILEYSHDGSNFRTIDEIIYNPSNFNSYTVSHLTQGATAFYRLSIIDKAGNKTVLSDIISVLKNINNTFSIYPNPNAGNFTLNFFSSRETQAEFVITDILGKTVQSIKLNANQGVNYAVPLNTDLNLSTGIYYITYKYGTSAKTIKLNILR